MIMVFVFLVAHSMSDIPVVVVLRSLAALPIIPRMFHCGIRVGHRPTIYLLTCQALATAKVLKGMAA